VDPKGFEPLTSAV